MPRTSMEEVDSKSVLVIWRPAGINRPYSVPENVTAKSITKEYFYIRSGTSNILFTVNYYFSKMFVSFLR